MLLPIYKKDTALKAHNQQFSQGGPTACKTLDLKGPVR